MYEVNKEVFSKRVREMRLARNKTQDELADYLGCVRSNISYYETGRNFPLTENMQKIAEFLETTPDYLMGNTHDPSSSVKESRMPIAIENLDDVMLTYRGKELTKEQKKHLSKLVQSTMALINFK